MPCSKIISCLSEALQRGADPRPSPLLAVPMEMIARGQAESAAQHGENKGNAWRQHPVGRSKLCLFGQDSIPGLDQRCQPGQVAVKAQLRLASPQPQKCHGQEQDAGQGTQKCALRKIPSCARPSQQGVLRLCATGSHAEISATK